MKAIFEGSHSLGRVPSACTMQAKYWRCLRALSEPAVLNPYATPYAIAPEGRRASLDEDQLSPRHLAKKPRPSHGPGYFDRGSGDRDLGAAPETPRAARGVLGASHVYIPFRAVIMGAVMLSTHGDMLGSMGQLCLCVCCSDLLRVWYGSPASVGMNALCVSACLDDLISV
jgi:hypothetical protein